MQYSQRRIFNDELVVKKNVQGRLNKWKCVSGDDGVGGKQVLSFAGIHSTSIKRFMKNFYLVGKIHFGGSATSSSNAEKTVATIMKDLNNALDTHININGSVVDDTKGVCITPILKSYSEKYKSPFDTDKQYEYSKKSVKMTFSGDSHTATINEDIEFSVPLLVPLLLNGLSGVHNLELTITQNYNLYSILKFENLSTNNITVGLKNCYIYYEEYDTGSEIFKQTFPYFYPIQKQFGSNLDGETECESSIRDIQGCPDDVFVLVAYDGSIITEPLDGVDVKSRTEKISQMMVDINTDSNAFNSEDKIELFARCKQHNYKGELSDFLGNSDVNNEYSPVIRIPMKTLCYDISNKEIFRCNVRNVKTKTATASKCKLTLYVVYCYNALLTLSPEKSTFEYVKSGELMGEIQEGEDDDVLGAGFFDKVKSFVKNGGISRWAGKVARIADTVAGPNNKVSGIADTVSNVASMLGASTNVF